ncbi:MAG: BrnT family toxin [Alphaproteobacteria bacterium]
MPIEFDPQKDARNIALRGISLAAAETLLSGYVVEREDDRRDYGGIRIVALGEIGGVEYVCAYTRRGKAVRPISLRRAKRKERDVYREAKAAHNAANQARTGLGSAGGADR